MDRFMKFWPIVALALSVASMGVTGWFQIKANAQDIITVSEDWQDEARRLWTRLQEMVTSNRDNEKAINDLSRSDDRIQAKIELEATKLRAEINDANREQTAKLDAILRAIQAQ